MTAPKSITDLVSLFTTNRESYCSSSYKETELRQEFLNPFFEALGWDVANKQGYAEAYKEVIHEEALKVGTATRRRITRSVSAARGNFSSKRRSPR